MTTTKVASSRRPRMPSLDVWKFLQNTGAWLMVVALVVGGYYAAHHWLPGGEAPETEETVQKDAEPIASEPLALEVNAEKRSVMNLVCQTIETSEYQPTRTIPGTVAFDSTKKVDVRAPIDAIVLEVMVRPGQHVSAKQALLRISGMEIGTARVGVNQALATLSLANTSFDWANETNQNLLELLDMLKQGPSLVELNQRFENKSLGTHRSDIFTAYSKWQLATKQVDRAERPETQGAIPQKVIDERKKELDVAHAELDGLIEESRFQTLQDLKKAQADRDQATQALETAKERLAALLGPFAQIQVEPDESEKTDGPLQDKELGINELILISPQDGDVVELRSTPGSRFQSGETIVVLANTQDVWVEGQIPQQDVGLLNLQVGQAVTVVIPGASEDSFDAKIKFFSTSVSSDSLALPLTAEIQNNSHGLRPGMMAWVAVPFGAPRTGLAIPESAIQTEGDRTFVFVEVDPTHFKRTDVEVGEHCNSFVEIKSGIKAGDRIVTQNAFFLKSEMLLESE